MLVVLDDLWENQEKALNPLDPNDSQSRLVATTQIRRLLGTKNSVDYQLDWVMGTPVGVWGGTCTCPDGHVYTAGDQGNICGSLACFGGQSGPCIESEGTWSFREVHCAEPEPTPLAEPAGAASNRGRRDCKLLQWVPRQQ